MNYKNIKYFPSNKHFHLTKTGLDNLRVQLNNLRKEQTAICKRILNMDIKDREDFISSTDAGRRLEVIESEVYKVSNILQHADVLAIQKQHFNVELGSTVFLESDFHKVKYTLVNSVEADPSANKISEDSPLGRALLGKKEHSTIQVASPRVKMFLYKILAVK